MSGTILIRNASHEDASAIASIHVRTWQAAYADMIPADFLGALSVEKPTTFWESELSANRSVNRVAVENDNIVGGYPEGQAGIRTPKRVPKSMRSMSLPGRGAGVSGGSSCNGSKERSHKIRT